MLEPNYRCGVTITLGIIGGKWKGLILWHLRLKTLRFSQLQRRLQTVTQKMQTQQLRELEADGLVHRQVYAEVPPRVEYSLTEHGRSVVPILELMCQWGQAREGRKGSCSAIELQTKGALALDSEHSAALKY